MATADPSTGPTPPTVMNGGNLKYTQEWATSIDLWLHSFKRVYNVVELDHWALDTKGALEGLQERLRLNGTHIIWIPMDLATYFILKNQFSEDINIGDEVTPKPMSQTVTGGWHVDGGLIPGLDVTNGKKIEYYTYNTVERDNSRLPRENRFRELGGVIIGLSGAFLCLNHNSNSDMWEFTSGFNPIYVCNPTQTQPNLVDDNEKAPHAVVIPQIRHPCKYDFANDQHRGTSYNLSMVVKLLNPVAYGWSEGVQMTVEQAGAAVKFIRDLSRLGWSALVAEETPVGTFTGKHSGNKYPFRMSPRNDNSKSWPGIGRGGFEWPQGVGVHANEIECPSRRHILLRLGDDCCQSNEVDGTNCGLYILNIVRVAYVRDKPDKITQLNFEKTHIANETNSFTGRLARSNRAADNFFSMQVSNKPTFRAEQMQNMALFRSCLDPYNVIDSAKKGKSMSFACIKNPRMNRAQMIAYKPSCTVWDSLVPDECGSWARQNIDTAMIGQYLLATTNIDLAANPDVLAVLLKLSATLTVAEYKNLKQQWGVMGAGAWTTIWLHNHQSNGDHDTPYDSIDEEALKSAQQLQRTLTSPNPNGPGGGPSSRVNFDDSARIDLGLSPIVGIPIGVTPPAVDETHFDVDMRSLNTPFQQQDLLTIKEASLPTITIRDFAGDSILANEQAREKVVGAVRNWTKSLTQFEVECGDLQRAVFSKFTAFVEWLRAYYTTVNELIADADANEIAIDKAALEFKQNAVSVGVQARETEIRQFNRERILRLREYNAVAKAALGQGPHAHILAAAVVMKMGAAARATLTTSDAVHRLNNQIDIWKLDMQQDITNLNVHIVQFFTEKYGIIANNAANAIISWQIGLAAREATIKNYNKLWGAMIYAKNMKTMFVGAIQVGSRTCKRDDNGFVEPDQEKPIQHWVDTYKVQKEARGSLANTVKVVTANSEKVEHDRKRTRESTEATLASTLQYVKKTYFDGVLQTKTPAAVDGDPSPVPAVSESMEALLQLKKDAIELNTTVESDIEYLKTDFASTEEAIFICKQAKRKEPIKTTLTGSDGKSQTPPLDFLTEFTSHVKWHLRLITEAIDCYKTLFDGFVANATSNDASLFPFPGWMEKALMNYADELRNQNAIFAVLGAHLGRSNSNALTSCIAIGKKAEAATKFDPALFNGVTTQKDLTAYIKKWQKVPKSRTQTNADGVRQRLSAQTNTAYERGLKLNHWNDIFTLALHDHIRDALVLSNTQLQQAQLIHVAEITGAVKVAQVAQSVGPLVPWAEFKTYLSGLGPGPAAAGMGYENAPKVFWSQSLYANTKEPTEDEYGIVLKRLHPVAMVESAGHGAYHAVDDIAPLSGGGLVRNFTLVQEELNWRKFEDDDVYMERYDEEQRSAAENRYKELNEDDANDGLIAEEARLRSEEARLLQAGGAPPGEWSLPQMNEAQRLRRIGTVKKSVVYANEQYVDAPPDMENYVVPAWANTEYAKPEGTETGEEVSKYLRTKSVVQELESTERKPMQTPHVPNNANWQASDLSRARRPGGQYGRQFRPGPNWATNSSFTTTTQLAPPTDARAHKVRQVYVA